MPSVLALQHVAFEDLGLIEGVLRARGWGVRYCNVPTDDLSSIDPRQDDLVIVLGGPIGVYEEKAYPFLKDEIAWIKARLQSARPILGICLGAQLMACALGAKVYPGPAKEIGWAPIQLSKAGQQSSLKHIGAKKTPCFIGMGTRSICQTGQRCWPRPGLSPIKRFNGGVPLWVCSFTRK